MKVVFKHMLEKFDFFSQMKRELEIQWRLDHPNIVKYYEMYDDKKHTYLVMEHVTGKKLQEKIMQ